MANLTIRRLTGKALVQACPNFLRQRLPKLDESEVLTVLFFPFDDRHVVFSGTAEHALKRLREREDEGHRVVAVGAEFTREAAGILTEAGIQILAGDTHFWTDESLQTIRQGS
jgi:hypothetical protein